MSQFWFEVGCVIAWGIAGAAGIGCGILVFWLFSGDKNGRLFY